MLLARTRSLTGYLVGGNLSNMLETSPMGLRVTVANTYTRAKTSTLRRLGLRDRVLRRRLERERSRRAAAEGRGDDSLSRPALHELDTKLYSIMASDGGFFVEAGAHDGFTQSNTYWLERFHGWRGLLIEPIPELVAEARLSRPDAKVVQCALVPESAQGTNVSMRAGDLFSMISGVSDDDWTQNGTFLGWRDAYELNVEARSLSSLLHQMDAPEVDFLSLDVEGFEADALEGIDFTRHAPRFILVEIHDPDSRRPAIDAVLSEYYVAEGWLSPLDLLYIRKDVVSSVGGG
jgi:FkbM family methyltransferase